MTMSPYSITATLSTEDALAIYRAVRRSDGRAVLLKVLEPKQARPRDLVRLRNEYEIRAALEKRGGELALETHEGRPVLVIADEGGQPLEALIGAPMEVGRFLRLAVRITEAVRDIHQRGVIHKDLKPASILIRRDTDEAQILDFGIATLAGREQVVAAAPGLIEGSLPYMSPEQTGRMNRAIDSRSDLYSLGIVFYETITGRLPFQAADPLEWVHCHLARAPAPPANLPSVPWAVSAIILKLLAKEAEDRYQTAAGLLYDLERCLDKWLATGQLDHFRLGAGDRSDRFQIPQKLYGRDAEVKRLLGAFDSVSTTGRAEVVLVSGYSGIGKSSLVRELQQPIVRARAFFASGKIDQYQRNIPYSTMAQAFGQLVRDLLTESEEQLEAWRERLSAALGSNGQLIVEVIPQLELVIGKQPPVAELPLAEAENRFHVVFRQLVAAFACREHPLVLFLDDLQWADTASRKLLPYLVGHRDTEYLLLIAAYRSNEVGPSHPLTRTLDEVKQSGARVQSIVLSALDPQHLAELVADTVRCRPDTSWPLARLLHEKTAGNPFFAIQLLTALHQEGLIAFDPGAVSWRWDIEKIQTKSYADNVVDLMAGQLRQLPEATREVLELAACVGHVAELGTLALLAGRSEEEVRAELKPALDEGLLVRLGDTYTFVHDRIQEAAYSLIPVEERVALHLRIGRLLVERLPAEALEDRVFDVANQLNLGAALITDPVEQRRLAELNLQAGKKAKAASAYASAAGYLAAGMELSAALSWDQAYALTYALHLERATCEFLAGDLAKSQELLTELLVHARTRIEKVAVYSLQLALFETMGAFAEALSAAAACLQMFGIELVAHPSEEQIQKEYAHVWENLGQRRIEELAHLPPMADPDMRGASQILAQLFSLSSYFDLNLFVMVSCLAANLSIRHGNSEGSPMGYGGLGIVLGPQFGKWQEGYQFGQLAYGLVEKGSPLKAKLCVVFGGLIYPWTRPLRTALPFAEEGYIAGVETGDGVFAAYNLLLTMANRLVLGDPLEAVQQESERLLDFVRRAKIDWLQPMVLSCQRLVMGLRGRTHHLSTFSSADFDGERFEAEVEQSGIGISIAWACTWMLQARFMSGDYRRAIELGDRVKEVLWTTIGRPPVSEFHYYYALAVAARSDGAREPVRRVLVEHQRRFSEWAENCPENFFGRGALLAAELARIEGRELDAMRLYDEAIRAARANGATQDEGIGNELAARFYAARGFQTSADAYLREARACYVRWGADGKVRQLDELHPRLFEPGPRVLPSTFALPSEQIDLLAVTKASQTISSETSRGQLVETLVRQILEQGGAQKAFLVECRGDGLWIQAEARADEREVRGQLAQPLAVDGQRLPVSILHFARRTRDRVLLVDAAADAGAFTADEYLARQRPRSVLCLPILREGEAAGLLYLENNLVAGAFTPERMVALELLATQAAISLENARLLEQEQAARAHAERAERRAAFLSGATGLIGESLEPQEVLRRLAQVAVRDLCDWCVIDLLEEEQGRERIERIAGAHADPAKQAALEVMRQHYPPKIDSPHPAARVLRTGESFIWPDVDDDMLRGLSVDERHVELLRDLGTRSGMSVPLVARGRVIGAFTVGSGEPRRFGPADLELLKELAHRAASAIDNARLYQQTQEAVRLRDEFLSVASHELRTPITSLQLVVQGLRSGVVSPTPEHIQRVLGVTERQVGRLGRLIEDLLGVSRIQAGQLVIDSQDCDLVSIVEDVAQRLEAELARAGCTLSLRAPAPVVGRWDRGRLEQVVTNLLSNALKFAAGKPIEISVEAVPPATARLTIVDHGIGIGKERMPYIFDRFERAVSAREYGGLGLGLYIVRNIVDALGGTVRAESVPKLGSTFTVELPSSGPTTGGGPGHPASFSSTS